MKDIKPEEIRQAVRENYARIAGTSASGCGCASTNCCEEEQSGAPDSRSLQMGYTSEELAAVPAGADLGLGCGNPAAIAALRPGETVLDLGSGAGFDCFLAARAVGETGRIIGVDMTPEMIAKARENAARGGFRKVEFRLGEIEHLPVADAQIDVIISNCVINLSPDKPQVFREAYRVLKPGGRLAVSDIVTTAPLPQTVREDLSLYAGCIAGASLIDDLQTELQTAGFDNIRISPKDESKRFIRDWAPERNIDEYLISAYIEALKPA